MQYRQGKKQGVKMNSITAETRNIEKNCIGPGIAALVQIPVICHSSDGR